ncbi:MAG TPA: hypothetical protein VGF93_16530 [Solirubrobacteraceae bacterium]|jgi:hypothetical protein
MTTGEDDPATPGGQPTEEELRAAYEAEISKVKVEHVLLEQVVTMINLGMRRTGLMPGTESERDPAQVRLAVDSIRALLPMVEQAAPQQVSPIREALSQLQLAYVRIGGAPPGTGEAPPGAGEAPPGPGEAQPGPGADQPPSDPQSPPPASGPQQQPPANPEEPGPAQRSGRLWVPGQ